MSDEEFITAFEACTLPAANFHHADHVRMAFLYLGRYPALEALRRFSDALMRFAVANGKPNRYHETITWAFLFLVRERLERSRPQEERFPTWDEFADRNSDLLSWEDNILNRYYREETLASDFARRMFVFPDRIVER